MLLISEAYFLYFFSHSYFNDIQIIDIRLQTKLVFRDDWISCGKKNTSCHPTKSKPYFNVPVESLSSWYKHVLIKKSYQRKSNNQRIMKLTIMITQASSVTLKTNMNIIHNVIYNIIIMTRHLHDFYRSNRIIIQIIENFIIISSTSFGWI